MQDTLELGYMVINLGGGLALFLYGMHKMTEALKLVAGERARLLLSKLTSNRFSAAFAGTVITAVIQSSSITTVLVVGFITAGIMTFQQSIGVILGANVGTTITAQIIAFKITESALFMIAAGFFTEVLAHSTRIKQFGVMIMGLGMLFFGMELMSQATAPLRTYEPFMQTMREMTNPLWGVLIGATFTALVQSSSATTGIVIVMASQGLLTLETGIALIFGSNIGTCVTAVVSAVGKPREALQAAMAHVLFNTLGVLLFIFFIPQFADLVRQWSPVSAGLTGIELLAADAPRQIANAHTIFNVVNLLVFLGFTGMLARLILRIVPSLPPKPVIATVPQYLDRMYLDQPAMALDRVRLELDRVSQMVLNMIRDSFPTLIVGTGDRINTLVQHDKDIEILTDALTLYLRQLSSGDLVEPHPERLQFYQSVTNYLENISDIVETGIVADSRRRLSHNLEINESSERNLRNIYKDLFQWAQTTVEALNEDSVEKAEQVIRSKSRFNGLVEKARADVYSRLKTEHPEELMSYKLETSAIENFRRIHHVLRRICNLIAPDSEESTQ